MASQIATKPAAVDKPNAIARAPKRQRGRLRVAAILAAGREVFREKGYDATTMTEIAARSGTAIGSLYRFFPSKESLADALLQDYALQMTEGLSRLADPPPNTTAAMTPANLTPQGVANRLVDLMVALQEERSAALVLIEARGSGSAELKARYRKAMRRGIANILKKMAPHLPRPRLEAMTVVVVHVMKGVARTAEEEDPATCRVVLTEIRELIRLYLATVH
jgi:AcrR family transcriptional regulator